jgi:hypothetical protein
LGLRDWGLRDLGIKGFGDWEIQLGVERVEDKGCYPEDQDWHILLRFILNVILLA